MAVATLSTLRAYADTVVERVAPPEGFDWDPEIGIYRLTEGRSFFVSRDVSFYAPVDGETYYVGYAGGNDSNDGLTEGSSFLTIEAALAQPDVAQIRLFPKVYTRTLARIVEPTRSVSVVAVGGRAIIGSHPQPLTWSVHSGSIWVAARTAVLSVWDASFRDSFGDYERLTTAGSVGAMVAGSWFTDGDDVYVWTSDSREPDDDVRVYLDSAVVALLNTSVDLYLENIDLEGADQPAWVRGPNRLFAKNCSFKYGATGNGLFVQGAQTFLQRCRAAKNAADGFNYHIFGNTTAESIEVDCIGRHNGLNGDNINNGSTAHDGQPRMVRVNGRYFGNNGPQVADVGGCRSWNLGCYAAGSTGSPATQNSNFLIDDAGEMWLDTCESEDSTFDLDVGEDSIMRIRDLITEGNNELASGASVETY